MIGRSRNHAASPSRESNVAAGATLEHLGHFLLVAEPETRSADPGGEPWKATDTVLSVSALSGGTRSGIGGEPNRLTAITGGPGVVQCNEV